MRFRPYSTLHRDDVVAQYEAMITPNNRHPAARPDEQEPLAVRIKEACRLTGIGRSKLYELIASGEIEIVKIGAMTLVPFESLKGLVERAKRCP